MGRERWVTIGVAGLCGMIGAVAGGYVLAGYAVGSGNEYAIADQQPAYARERPVAEDYGVEPSYAAITPNSALTTAPLSSPAPLPEVDYPRYDTADYALEPEGDMPPPISLLPDDAHHDDMTEDAAAAGDTARARPVTPG